MEDRTFLIIMTIVSTICSILCVILMLCGDDLMYGVSRARDVLFVIFLIFAPFTALSIYTLAMDIRNEKVQNEVEQ